MSLKVYIKLLLVPIIFTSLMGCQKEESPYSPERALNTFELPKGFRIELVAAEPLISDPVEIAFDADGRLYVAEMSDYPAEGVPRSRVMLLEDKDRDGRYETGNVFAEDLPFVNGVMPWRNGVLVTTAPDIIYFEDTTGNGYADVRRVVLTGFAVTNPQLRMSSLRYGLDNWIYGAYSRSGGGRGYAEFTDHGSPLHFPDNPAEDSADIYPGTDFRFRPDKFKVEPSGGMSQFGMAFDAAGNRFTVWNNEHLRHVVLDNRYVTRNPYLSVNSVMASVPEHGGAASVYSIAEDRLDLHESEIGHFTSACGHSIYTGDIFTPDYQGAAFVCEPVSNLVHMDLLTSSGATFVGKAAYDKAEFLASTDSWFRPVNTTVGPDGALYIVDYYRKLVEHPAWIARADDEGIYTHAGVLQESDFLEGQDRGRIYRIVPEDYNHSSSTNPNLSTADTETLVEHLANPNMWWRTTAQRLLVERQDHSAIPALERLAVDSPSVEGKIHALWTLEGLGNLDDRLVLAALVDESPTVRKQAVLLAEVRLSNLEIKDRLLEMVSDPNDRVQFQVALALGGLSHDRSFEALQRIAIQHIDDPWFQTAILLSISENSLHWFQAVHRFEMSSEEEVQGKKDFLHKIASIVGARQRSPEISELLSFIEQEDETAFQVSSLAGLHEGLQQGSGQLRLSQKGQNDLLKLIAGPAPKVQNAALEIATQIDIVNSQAVQAAVNQALEIVLSEDAATDARTHAIRVLGLDPNGLRIKIFDRLLTPQQSVDVQLAVARVLVNSDDTIANRMLLDRWASYTSEVRGVVESGFLGTRERTSFLINAIEEGEIEPSWLSRTSRTQLTQQSDKEIQQRAEIVFGDLSEDRREEVVTRYHEATTLDGDILNGKAVFQETCSSCHQVKDIGYEIGPDLQSVTNRTRIDLLTMILDPNDNIAPGYEGYIIETADGRTLTGVMAHESSNNVILRAPGGAEQTIPRDNIKTARPMAASLMPDGLEANMSIQEMADLLEYLKNLGQ